jgi:hypothetical protein
MDLVTNTLTEGVTGSDILLAVLSPLYVQKPYCTFELDGFIEKRSEDGRRGISQAHTVGRQAAGSCDEISAEDQGHGLRAVLRNNRERAQDETILQGLRYHGSAAVLGLDPGRRLTAREKSGRTRRPRNRERRGKRAGPAKDVTVYLAVPSNDLKDAHYSLRNELESQGCHVVPTDPWPSDPSRRGGAPASCRRRARSSRFICSAQRPAAIRRAG